MTHTTLQNKRPSPPQPSADRFEQWIQAPVTEYGFTYVDQVWQPHLLRQPASSSLRPFNTTPSPTPAFFQSIALQLEDDHLLTDWLAVAQDTFNFWDNEDDAVYDNL